MWYLGFMIMIVRLLIGFRDVPRSAIEHISVFRALAREGKLIDAGGI
jgi:hypothetical protein